MRKLAANSKPEEFRHSIGGSAVLPWTTDRHGPDVAAGILVQKPGVTLAEGSRQGHFFGFAFFTADLPAEKLKR